MSLDSKARRLERRLDEQSSSMTLVLPPRLSLDGVAEGGICRRFPHALRSMQGQELYQNFPIRNPDRAGERVHPDQKVEMRAQFGLGGAGVLAQEAMPRKQVDYVRQDAIAEAMGCHRSTLSRTLHKARSVAFKRRFHGLYNYSTLIPEGPAPEKIGPKCRWTMSVDELAAADLPVKFAECKRKKSGFWYSQPWLHSPKLKDPRTGRRMKTTARTVFWMLQAWGLLQKQHGRIVDQITVPLTEIARDLSLRPETVRANLVPFERLGLISVVQQPPEKREDGSEFWPPVTIVWLPSIALNYQVAALERKRLRRCNMRRDEHTWWRNVGEVHEKLLAHALRFNWLLQHFWNECRRRMLDDGVPSVIVDVYIPRPPD
jgi:hypothetical protein